MVPRACMRSVQRATTCIRPTVTFLSRRTIACQSRSKQSKRLRSATSLQSSPFHTSPFHPAQSPTADALMEDLNELYSTARDEFEIAAEETEKKTVYAADDREAAADALNALKEAFAKALRETSPEVGKEIQGRVGSRIRELENAVKAMEEMAMED